MPSTASLFAGLLFGAIGMGAMIYGKKRSNIKAVLIGIGLSVYPFFIEETILMYGIGFALCVLLYFCRD
jgi:hypothetical protein